MGINLKTLDLSVQFYGVTKDPKSHKFMMVLEYLKEGNLRDFLTNNYYLQWEMKLNLLKALAFKFYTIQSLNVVHHNFNPRNILLKNTYRIEALVSNFGVIRSGRDVCGVLPYIAPEVLGGEECTKASNVYTFGIMILEIITGLPPHFDVSHDDELALKVCNGLRPQIPFYVPLLIKRMIMRCLDARVDRRPTFVELYVELESFYWNYESRSGVITLQIDESGKFESFSSAQSLINATIPTPKNYKIHPRAIYTSQVFNFSNLPKPINEENFEQNLQEIEVLTEMTEFTKFMWLSPNKKGSETDLSKEITGEYQLYMRSFFIYCFIICPYYINLIYFHYFFYLAVKLFVFILFILISLLFFLFLFK